MIKRLAIWTLAISLSACAAHPSKKEAEANSEDVTSLAALFREPKRKPRCS